MDDPATLFLGKPVADWLTVRGLELGGTDIQHASLFPVDDDPAMIAWMVADAPENDLRERWRAARRLSATDLLEETDVERLYAQRRAFLAESLEAMQRNDRASVFYSLDLERAATLLHRENPLFEPALPAPDDTLVKRMHDRMFRSALLRARDDAAWEAEEAQAFGTLRAAILASLPPPAEPRLAVAEDGLVWGRAPLRLDLAGGWTDTPPYCLLNGGRVLNVAVDLNGQPPVGVGVRRSWELNQALDSGTNPPSIQAILAPIDDLLLGAKLLGAGGGGFLFMVAKDLEAARRVRAILRDAPPSPRARFYDFRVSSVGLEVTRS